MLWFGSFIVNINFVSFPMYVVHDFLGSGVAIINNVRCQI